VTLLSLNLSRSNFVDLSLLNKLTKLRLLTIDDTKIAALTKVDSTLNIEVISFQNNSVEDIDPLLKLKRLKMVYCDHTKVTQEIVKEFLLKRPEVILIYETQSLQNWWAELNDNLKAFILSRLDTVTEPLSTEILHTIIFTETADLSGETQINSLEGFQQLINLKELNISGTMVSDLSPIAHLSQLSNLDISHTPVTELNALSSLNNLNYLSIEHTLIANIEALDSIVSLELVKGDSSAIKQEEALRFKDHSNAVLLYQSKHLLNWWEDLDNDWIHYFSKIISYNKKPSAKELQLLVNQDSLVFLGLKVNSIDEIDEFKGLHYLKLDDMNVSDMSVLPKLTRLHTLVINNAKISDFYSIQQLDKLLELDLSNTSLNNLDFIVALSKLKSLKISSTTVESIKALTTLKDLEYLDLSNTRVKRINYLNKLVKLKELKLTNTVINPRKITSFQRIRPEVNVVFY
jgi:internalin A